MHKAIKEILPIQEYDMQMIQLMRLKRGHQKQLQNINASKEALKQKATGKEGEILDLKKNVRLLEGEVKDIIEKIKKFESQQALVKKVDEFNALSQEISRANKEKTTREQRLSDLYDRVTTEDDLLKTLEKNLETTVEDSKALEVEVKQRIALINEEGQAIKLKRDALVENVDPEAFHVYEVLLKNKKDRVVVPIEDRCCSGCHVMLTAQHENVVRKGERVVFCEHCSRINYWPEHEQIEEGEPTANKQRRRRKAASAT